MLQSYFTAGCLFQSNVDCGKTLPWSDVVTQLTRKQKLSLGQISIDDQLTTKCVVFGTIYKKGLYVLIHCVKDYVRVVLAIAKNSSSAFLLVDLFAAKNVPGFDVYELTDMNDTELISIESLLDYEPLL